MRERERKRDAYVIREVEFLTFKKTSSKFDFYSKKTHNYHKSGVRTRDSKVLISPSPKYYPI